MTLDELKSSLDAPNPPGDLPPLIEALWRAAKGDWNAAHELVQNDSSRDAAWIHAYLHRVEGDHSNAAYWYRRSGKPICNQSHSLEWDQIAKTLIENQI